MCSHACLCGCTDRKGFLSWCKNLLCLFFFSYQNIKAHNYIFFSMKVCHFHGNQNFISDNVKRRKEGKSLSFLLQFFAFLRSKRDVA